jgi:hypothetical protein
MALKIRYSWKTETAEGSAICEIANDPPQSEAELRAIEVEVIGIAARRLETDEVEVAIFDWAVTSPE